MNGSDASLDRLLRRYADVLQSEDPEQAGRDLFERLQKLRRPTPWYVAMLMAACYEVSVAKPRSITLEMSLDTGLFLKEYDANLAIDVANGQLWTFGSGDLRSVTYVENLQRLFTATLTALQFQRSTDGLAYAEPSLRLIASLMVIAASADPAVRFKPPEEFNEMQLIDLFLSYNRKVGDRALNAIYTVVDVLLHHRVSLEPMTPRIQELLANREVLNLDEV